MPQPDLVARQGQRGLTASPRDVAQTDEREAGVGVRSAWFETERALAGNGLLELPLRSGQVSLTKGNMTERRARRARHPRLVGQRVDGDQRLVLERRGHGKFA